METQSAESVSLRDAPAIPGLIFRHFRGDEDYPAILEVNNGSKIADSLEHDLHTLETIKAVYDNTSNHDPLKDVLIAEVGGKAVAYIRIFWGRELDSTRIYTHVHFILPEARGKGIGEALVHLAEQRARELEATQEGGAPTYLSTSAYATMVDTENLLKAESYEPVRYEFHMQTPDLDHIPDVPMPEGFEVRPAKPEHYRAVWEATTEAFRDHWGAGEDEEEDFDRWLNFPMIQPDLWIVAWDGDQVAGSILNYINHEFNTRAGRKLGYTETISVRRPWRRRGLARALLARSMQMHKELGMTQTGLGVDTENPSGALRLYESMGYEVVSQSAIYRKRL